MMLAIICPSIAETQAMVMGKGYRLHLQTPHPLQGPSVDSAPIWEDVINHKGARTISIHFSKFELAPGAKMVISSPDGLQSYTYTGKGRLERGSFSSPRITGDTAIIKVFSEVTDAGFGYIINRYIAAEDEGDYRNLPVDKDPYVRHLKALYKQAGWILSGSYAGKERAVNSGRAHTDYTFDKCVQLMETPYYGRDKPDDITIIPDYHRSSILDTAKRGERYIVFIDASNGSLNKIFPETEERLKLIRGWVKHGVYLDSELKDLRYYSDWIAVVKAPIETCSRITPPKETGCIKSTPCEHRWRYPVTTILKGQNVPKEIDIHSKVRAHSGLAHYLKTPSLNGKLILFLEEYATWGTDILGAVPWSAAMEEMLMAIPE